MNYRHAYHAGNFADVFKHCILTALLKTFHRKETPFCFLDTHAGIGNYDLLAATTQKSKEYQEGIVKIIDAIDPPTCIADYLNFVKNFSAATPLRFYPGSPLIAKHLLRPQDRMMLCELHPDDFQLLKRRFAHDKRVNLHHQDGYQSLKSLLPPKEKRGLILIDPPYEDKCEFNHMISALKIAFKRFETGVYAIWYPIKDRHPIENFQRELKNIASRPILKYELMLYPDDVATRFNGCRMLIINPPFQIAQELNAITSWLQKHFSCKINK